MNRPSTIYVAGPMRGYPLWNYPAFDHCSDVLRKQGWEVVNPAELDRDAERLAPVSMVSTSQINYADDEFMRKALRRDMIAICDNCTAIYMMSNWERSKGARAELAIAKAIGLDVYFEGDSLPTPTDEPC